MKIIVLAAGTSTERDVSIVTGTRVCAALRRKGHKAEVMDVFLGVDKNYEDIQQIFEENTNLEELEKTLKEKSKDIKGLYEERQKKCQSFFGPNVLEACKAADIVFMGLHGANGEDGKIQATFDLLGIKYTGTGYLSSAISMNKSLSKLSMVAANIPMPKGITLILSESDKKDKALAYSKMEQRIIEEVGIPCVIKPCCGGSSVGVSLVFEEKDIKNALEVSFEYEDSLLVEEYIKGREFSVGIMDNKALPVIEMEPISGFYDYKNKYVPGMTKDTCPANIPQEISDKMKEYAVMSAKALGLETYGRIDCLLKEDGSIYCLEMNTLPGMTGTSLIPQEALVEGMEYDDLCEHIIKISLARWE